MFNLQKGEANKDLKVINENVAVVAAETSLFQSTFIVALFFPTVFSVTLLQRKASAGRVCRPADVALTVTAVAKERSTISQFLLISKQRGINVVRSNGFIRMLSGMGGFGERAPEYSGLFSYCVHL